MANAPSKISILRDAYEAKHKGWPKPIIELDESLEGKGKPEFAIYLKHDQFTIKCRKGIFAVFNRGHHYAWSRFYTQVAAGVVNKLMTAESFAHRAKFDLADAESIEQGAKLMTLATLPVYDFANLSLIDVDAWIYNGRPESGRPTHEINLQRYDRPTGRKFYFRLQKNLKALGNEILRNEPFMDEVHRAAAHILATYSGNMYHVFIRDYTHVAVEATVDSYNPHNGLYDLLRQSEEQIFGLGHISLTKGIFETMRLPSVSVEKKPNQLQTNVLNELVGSDKQLKKFKLLALRYCEKALGVKVDNGDNTINVSVGDYSFLPASEDDTGILADIIFDSFPGVMYTLTATAKSYQRDPVTGLKISDFDLDEVDREITKAIRAAGVFIATEGLTLPLDNVAFKIRRDTIAGK